MLQLEKLTTIRVCGKSWIERIIVECIDTGMNIIERYTNGIDFDGGAIWDLETPFIYERYLLINFMYNLL